MSLTENTTGAEELDELRSQLAKVCASVANRGIDRFATTEIDRIGNELKSWVALYGEPDPNAPPLRQGD